jgi:LmbE family N-acetylglucosaminyl deacetylase
MTNPKLRIMSIMAHQDDFEFNAGGSFALLRKTLGDDVELKVVATTRGASGHHEMSLEDTYRRREGEATASAAKIGATYECLRLLDGSHLPAQVFIDRNLLGGLWNTIRDFEPDVIFCPPVISDPLAGVHIDHINTAHAVRLVAYQIIVPNAYPTTNGPRKDRVACPLIINVDDSYASESGYDIRQDITETYQIKTEMGLAHESQILEWLPWTINDPAPTREEWVDKFNTRHLNINTRYGNPDGILSEYFRITRWGRAPKDGELNTLFPHRIT